MSKRGRPKKANSVKVHVCFSLNNEYYVKMLEVMEKEGFEQLGTFIKSILIKYLNQYK